MSVAALGEGARPLPPLPDGAGSWAALTASASSAGAGLALALLLLALALAASDIIRTTPAQMRATVRNLPMHMPIDEKSAPSLPRRRLRSAQVRFLAPGPAALSASSGIAMVSSRFLWRRISAQAREDGHTLLLDAAERQVEQCPFHSPSASNRSALGARLRWRAARAANVPPRRNAGRHCAKESSHLATLVPSALPPPTRWPRREVIAEAYEFRRRMSQFRSPAFPPRCGKSITVGIDPSSRMQGQFQAAWR